MLLLQSTHNGVLMLDANAILRFLLKDIEPQYDAVCVAVRSKLCFAPLEIISEVVYVLEGVYHVSREDVVKCLGSLLKDIEIINSDVLLRALEIFNETPKLDFVDCLLYGYKYAKGVDILTFDSKLSKKLEGIE